MRYIIEYKPQRVKPVHISQEVYWRARGRHHPNGWRVIGIAGAWQEAVAVAEQYCQRHLALDLHRRLLQKATLSPAEKRWLQKLKRRIRTLPDEVGAGSG